MIIWKLSLLVIMAYFGIVLTETINTMTNRYCGPNLRIELQRVCSSRYNELSRRDTKVGGAGNSVDRDPNYQIENLNNIAETSGQTHVRFVNLLQRHDWPLYFQPGSEGLFLVGSGMACVTLMQLTHP
ncbi:hypothetical protein C0J52_14525 [Blattella germanica]|nr:hypothetical protein C0J52_14525 [Blattella germanica]